MATVLLNVVAFVGVAPGVPTALAHGINIDGVALAPDRVELDNADFSVVSATATTVTVQNNSAIAANVNVLCERWHTIPRVLPPGVLNLTPQPFVPAVGGGTPLPPPPLSFDYLIARKGSLQNANVAVGNHVEWGPSARRGTNIAITTGGVGQANGIITLQPGVYEIAFLVTATLAVTTSGRVFFRLTLAGTTTPVLDDAGQAFDIQTTAVTGTTTQTPVPVVRSVRTVVGAPLDAEVRIISTDGATVTNIQVASWLMIRSLT